MLIKKLSFRVHFKLSHPANRGRWVQRTPIGGHRPGRAAPVGAPTNRRRFEMHPFFIIGVFLCILQVNCLVAQDRQDSAFVIEGNAVDTSGKSLLALDPAIRKFHDPKIATFRSAVLPGWGQAYNKKYWKIPIIYAALGITTGVFFYNIKTYNEAAQAVIYRSDTIDANDALISPDLAAYSTENIRQYRNILRQNIDYSVLVFLVFWALNVVDATVDAHLKAFDVGPDISLKLKPGFNYMANSAGLSLVLTFRDKKPKHFMPLP